jgi:hypothetical protein
MMAAVVQQFKRPARSADTSADAVQLPSRAISDRIARTASTCEILSESIDILQRNLKTLDGVVGAIDDSVTREKLQEQMKSMDALLKLRLAELSSIELTLQAALRAHRQNTYKTNHQVPDAGWSAAITPSVF